MRVLIYSPAFLPLIGGLEHNVALLAESLRQLGNEVVVVTTTPAEREEEGAFQVVRRPGPVEFVRWVRWCEVFHQANVSLWGLWPLLFVRRPWVASHHGTYRRPGGRIGWKDRLKRYFLRWADGSIAVSQAMADDLATPAVVIPNAYRDSLFRQLEGVERRLDLVFVGRLVSEKGVDLLFEALVLLRERGREPTLTVVGEGPEEQPLRALAERLGLARQVCWQGPLRGERLAAEMNRHAILVVPSLFGEPFGIVALEGIACGCVVVGSSGGGLRDAIGPCGLTFPNGDAMALAGELERALTDEGLRRACAELAPVHLAAHSPFRQAEQYQEVMTAATTRPSARRVGR